MSAPRRPRLLHPGAWWLWAACLAVAASRTTNPLLLLLIIAVCAYVVAARRPNAPWARSFAVFLRLGLVIIAVRVAFQVLMGAPLGTTVLFTLPTLALPEQFAGVRLGGAVTLESVVASLYEGLRLATIIAAIGAANSLASPARLLKSVPAALYELGVSLVVALTFAPQLVGDLERVRQARRLRGRPTRGMRGLAGAAVPVLEDALERSAALAAAMDSRGYGRTAANPASPRLAQRTASAALLLGLVAALVGCYGLLDATAPALLGLPMLVVGLGLAVAGLFLAGRRSVRTRYRPDPWALPEWGVAACGLATATAYVAAGMTGVPGLAGPVDPLAWPAVPPLLVAATLLSLLPAWIAPPLPTAPQRQTEPQREPTPEAVVS
ncbi:MAG: energy-coupling factor transporter transmembrane component T [bacterium]